MSATDFDDPFPVRSTAANEASAARNDASVQARRREMLVNILERCAARGASLADLMTLAKELGLTMNDFNKWSYK